MGGSTVFLRVVAVQCSVSSLRPVHLAIGVVAVVGQELGAVEVVLSGLGTNVSGIRHNIALLASSKDSLGVSHAAGQAHLAKRYGSLAAVKSSFTLVCYPVAVRVHLLSGTHNPESAGSM